MLPTVHHLLRASGRLGLAAPPAMARSTGLSGAVSGNWPCSATPGCATILGRVPRCGQVAACTRNGWQRKTSPARPVASTVGRCSVAAAAACAASSHAMPASPAGASTRAASRCDPGRSRVGALASSTSVSR